MLNEQPFRSNALGRVTMHESICHSLMVAMVFSSLYALSGPLFSSFPLFTYLTYNMSYFAWVLPIKLHSYLRAHVYSAAKGIQERRHQKGICWLVCVSKLHKSHWECNDMPPHTHFLSLFTYELSLLAMLTYVRKQPLSADGGWVWKALSIFSWWYLGAGSVTPKLNSRQLPYSIMCNTVCQPICSSCVVSAVEVKGDLWRLKCHALN